MAVTVSVRNTRLISSCFVRYNKVCRNKLESTQRVQTSAVDFHVLFLAVYRSRNSK